eukprot:TRINITY_DN8743_c0_g1_i1.p1 TRINITY_DN8743_c0_g1~~TRINITY_DN8743_c0_g1_i1.p1  ORF type:complete len:355 (-),score=99.77 TRINITY_DN8743_c0_g1_i1:50-1114(-)
MTIKFTFGTPVGTPAPATPAPAFSFGAPATPAPTSGFGFGAPATPAPSSTPSLFGAPSTSLFGAPATPAPSAVPSLFGPPAGTPSLFPQTPATGMMPGMTPGMVPALSMKASPAQKIKSLGDAWNRASPDCRFRHMLYNRVPPEDVEKYARPADVNEKLWEQAQNANWDPKHLVPVQATGFGDLQLRIESQQNVTQQQQQLLEEIQQFLTNSQRKHDLDFTIRIDESRRRHAQLSHRMMQLMKKLEVLCSRGYPIVGEEDIFRSKLEMLANQLAQPNHFKSRLTELQASIKMQEDRPADRFDMLEQDALESLQIYLAEQTEGLSHLATILQKDMRDIGLIVNALTGSSTTHLMP